MQQGKKGWQPTALRAHSSTAAATTEGWELSRTGSSRAQRSSRVVALYRCSAAGESCKHSSSMQQQAQG
jgi:hypothetical protein